MCGISSLFARSVACSGEKYYTYYYHNYLYKPDNDIISCCNFTKSKTQNVILSTARGTTFLRQMLKSK